MGFRAKIGLEVHAQLLTDSKMFCGCSTRFGETANSQCCPVCSGTPGTLPVANRKAIEYVIKTGLALGCQVAERCRFARKNYFYPDMPKNYQISQYEEPLTFGGQIEVEAEDETARIGIRRVHLEEDTGKNFHLPDGTSLVEYNRAGVPLMEIVTEPDFASAEQVRAYLTKLREILRYLGVSSGNMEEGAMRCEPTVNLVDAETGARTEKVEIKNLASIRGVYEAVRYEIRRQLKAVEDGETVRQETRRWSEEKGETQVMRTKESAEDYMYFPDPDLVPMAPSREWVEAIRATLPELPAARRERFVREYELPAYDAEVLTSTKAAAEYFEELVALTGDAKQASNWLMGPVTSELNARSLGIEDCPLPPAAVAELMGLVAEGRITGKIARDVFPRMFESGKSAAEIVAAEGLAVVGGEDELGPILEEAIAANPKAVDDYRAGKEKAKGALVGAVMKATKGQADPATVNRLIEERLRPQG
ncbi:MAG: Asp-tRNA(Asn)/Glu-tRNA(Gln) amidotransferase subunit GatB [Armatimonadetes bacterium]|nr:Asp-tRNA(Asn)/Glu-tRNA(Gln) amidotransferase subunit GatB [Armatimonadota bacterium]